MTNNEAMKVIEMFADNNGYVSVDKVREVIHMIGSSVETCGNGTQIPASIPSTNGSPMPGNPAYPSWKPVFTNEATVVNPNITSMTTNSNGFAPTSTDWSPKHI